jgi:hypothetical protein
MFKRSRMAKTSFSRAGFLLCCFLLPGLIGTFATFSIPAPLVDEQHQQAALEAVLSAPDATARAAAIQNLSGPPGSAAQNDMLGAADDATPGAVDADTAALVTNGTGPLAARVAAAEANMRREVVAQARDAAYKIRLMLITMTLLGAGFGVALLGKGNA